MDPAEQQKVVDEWGKIGIATVDAITGEWRMLPGILEGIDKEILAKQLELAGLLSESMKIGLETPDLPSSQFGQLKGNIEYYRKLLMSNPAGAALLAQEKPEKLAILFSDNIVKELTTSRTLFSLAMRDIIKNQEKQLEGIFNIPEGMTALIPYTGRLYFSDQPIDKGEGAGGLLEALGPPIDEFGTSTGEFAGAVDKLVGVIGATPAGAKAQEAKIDRMEQEWEKEWQAAHPEATAAPDPEAMARAQRLAEISARKEADYIPEPAETPTPKNFGDWINEIFNSIMRDYQAKSEKYNFNPEEVKAMGPGEDFVEWIKSLFEQLGALAQTFSQNWGTGADVQRGLSEAERQNLLPTEGPKVDTSNVIEDLKFIFDSIMQTAGQYMNMFKEELGIGGAGAGTGGGGKGLASPAPMSLPVTINTRIVNQVSVLLDGVKIQQAINERQNTTLKTASRRAGTGGFIVEA